MPRFANERLVCKVHNTNHSLDHFAIEIFFILNKFFLLFNVNWHLFKNIT